MDTFKDTVAEAVEQIGAYAVAMEQRYLDEVADAVGHELSDSEVEEAYYVLAEARNLCMRRAMAALGLSGGDLTATQEVAATARGASLFGEFMDEIRTREGYAFWRDLLS